jgi:hypothetical protein
MTITTPCNPDITIISCSYGHSEILNHNIQLMRRKNQYCQFKWVVAECTPAQDQGLYPPLSKEFDLIQGQDKPTQYYAPSSYQHALSLNKALQYVETRYLLVLDPDFFVLRKESLSEMIGYMKSKHIHLLGVPWHPRHYIKYKDFPCLHCLMIDTAHIDKASIDFQPIYENGQLTEFAKLPIYMNKPWMLSIVRHLGFVDRVLSFLRIDLLSYSKRLTIGRSMDTGARLYMQYFQDDNVSVETLMPIRHKSQSVSIAKPGLYKERIVDRLMPRHFKLDPGPYSSLGSLFSTVSADLAPEEFSWKGLYFGFHLRMFPKDNQKKHDIINSLSNWLSW